MIGVSVLKRLMSGGTAAFFRGKGGGVGSRSGVGGDTLELLLSAPDGTPLMGKDLLQARLVLKVAVVVKEAATPATPAAGLAVL